MFIFKYSLYLYLGAPKSPQMVTAAIKLKAYSLEESYDKPRQCI